MSNATQAQLKVATYAEELVESEELIDLSRPYADRRLSLEESLTLVRERYSEAIRLLGRLTPTTSDP